MSSEVLPIFRLEAHELSDAIEAALLKCESGVADSETINTLFRAMHTIKGSAGLFGLDDVVAFAHVLETALVRLRDGTAAMSPDLVSNLLACRDHLDSLIECAVGESVLSPAAREVGKQLLADLQAHVGTIAVRADTKAVTPAHAAPAAGSECWHISVRYMPDTLRNGMDPLAALMFLSTFGEIRALEVLDDALPTYEEFDPEACYLGFECRFATGADRARIESTFEFVRDDSILTILPPCSRVADYVKLIQELPESEARLGEILVKCGSITQIELDAALAEQRRAATVRPLGEILVERQVVAPVVVEAAVDKQRATAEARSRDQRTIRVDSEKIELLLNLVGELVVEGAQAKHLAQRTQNPPMQESAARLSRLVEQVRDHSLKLRMMPIGATFARFSRIVRDSARELGKQIALETRGDETELDKTLIEQITDPLTHLVRNSIDHGIEAADVRAARGKSAQGVIRLNAYHDSGSVVIEISDDGGGLDRARILSKAVERGLVAAGASPSDREIDALIFAPGFSTASQVTNLSGRGVGMDVVKRNVMNLRGSIDIESTPGAGTTMRIRLPLTLAIIDGFLVRVANSSFVLPLGMVEECVEAEQAEKMFAEGRRFIDLRGQVLPCVRLREHFSLHGRAGRRESVVVVKAMGQRVGLLVEELLGEYQTVIKPLASVFQNVRGLGGSTILADGAIALILDLPALLQHCKAGFQPPFSHTSPSSTSDVRRVVAAVH